MKQEYSIELHYIPGVLSEKAHTNGYYFAFHPDFGHSACSATGSTIETVLFKLDSVRKAVIKYYIEQGYPIPKPTPFDPRKNP